MTASLDLFPTAIIPTLRYSDVPRAIDWLCDAFGFEKHLLIDEEDGGIAYAELSVGNSMIMVGPAEGSAFDRLMKQPDQIGGLETQICYLYVADVEAHRDRAIAAGAEIVLDMDAEGATGRGYSCRDPEGHIWNFGTYNPWHSLQTSDHGGRKPRTLLLSGLLLLVCVALGLAFGVPEPGFAERQSAGLAWIEPKDVAGPESDGELRKELAKLRTAKEASEQALRSVEEQLAFERNAHLVADRSLQEAQAKLDKDRTVVASISSGDRSPGEDLERERAARLAAERAVRDMREQLRQARSTTEAGERSLLEAQGQLAKAAAGRQAAERQLAERVGKDGHAQGPAPEARKASISLHARVARHRAARAAARARIRRLREAREPSIKPPLPYF
jgi:uncharacterized glyoxalase superfamily protein PhnB